jgi:feruloyl esterase
LHASVTFSAPLANGLDDYPGWGVSGEATPGFAATGAWRSWWLGSTPPAHPPAASNGIARIYGSGGIRHIFARDPNADITSYDPDKHMPRIREVSALMGSTNPDRSTFAGHGGKLIVLEHMADYAQSPYAGIRYFQAGQSKMGVDRVADFMRLYTAPGGDHVGSGAPANVDMLSVLVAWAEKGNAPGELTVTEQSLVSQGRAGTAPLPVARLAQVQGRRCGRRTQLRLACNNSASQRRQSWRAVTGRSIGRGRGSGLLRSGITTVRM